MELAGAQRAHARVLRFASLFSEGRALAFPCDERGQVDLDALPERARGNFFFARALVGREFAVPRVCSAFMALAD